MAIFLHDLWKVAYVATFYMFFYGFWLNPQTLNLVRVCVCVFVFVWVFVRAGDK